MNVTAIGYPNVVGLADSQRNFGNMILSDLNHHGVANAHEDTSPSVPACSFLGSAALERKGFLATTSTGAPAVREHGGGRAHRALLTQQPSGRPTRSTGGEIKSLCCAAAGIIALATRPCGAHAYPLTGVRRAAHPAAPLRSTPRPHAQPVKGYSGRPTINGFKQSAGGTQHHFALNIQRQNRAGVARFSEQDVHEVQRSTGRVANVEERSHIFCRPEVRQIESIEHVHGACDDRVHLSPLFTLRKSRQNALQSSYISLNSLNHPGDDLPLYLISLSPYFLGTSIGSTRNPNRDKDGSHGTYRLHPGGPVDALRKATPLSIKHTAPSLALIDSSLPAATARVHGGTP